MLKRQERHNEATPTALMSTKLLVQQDGCDNHTHEGKQARAYNITQCRRHCLLAQGERFNTRTNARENVRNICDYLTGKYAGPFAGTVVIKSSLFDKLRNIHRFTHVVWMQGDINLNFWTAFRQGGPE